MGCGRMNAAGGRLPEIARAGARRLVVTWMVLFAFTLQSYVTQTHLHRAPVVELVGKISAHGVSPAGDEAIACPFCQAIAAAGAFFSPAAIALGPLVVQPEAAAPPPIVVGLAIAPAGFSWRSRAPPQS